MATRAQVRFATREEGQSFNKHPSAIHAQFYVYGIIRLKKRIYDSNTNKNLFRK